MTQGGIEIFWYGMEMGVDFMLLSLFVLVAWVVAGLWQRMRRELLLRNRPWWWLAFLLFWISWSAGFFMRAAEKVWTFFFAAWAALTWMSGYALIFSEKKDAAFWIRFRAAWKRRDGELLQHLLPNWIVSFALALVLTFIALSLSGSGSFFRGLLCLVSLTAFVLRDTAWILWLNLKPGARHPDGAALVSLAVAYGVLPWIDALLFLPMMDVKRRWWSLSSWDFSSNATALALAIQILFAAVTLWLLHNRFRETFGKAPGIRDR